MIRRAVALVTLVAFVLVAIILQLRFRRIALVGFWLAPLVCGLSAASLLMLLLGVELNLLWRGRGDGAPRGRIEHHDDDAHAVRRLLH